MYACMYVCMHACMHVCMYVRAYIYIYIYIYMCVCVCVCVCIYIIYIYIGLDVDTRVANAAVQALASGAAKLRTKTGADMRAAEEAVEVARSILNDLMAVNGHAGPAAGRAGRAGRGMQLLPGYTPDTNTFTSFLSLLARAAAAGARNVEFDDGLSALASMRELGLEADAYNLASLLSLCAHAAYPPQIGRLARSRALVNEFKSEGVACDLVVYNGLLVVCARDSESTLQDAWAVVDEMMEAGLNPDSYTYATLIDIAARRAAAPAEADRVLKAMEERGVAVTTTVWNSYLKVLAKGAERGMVGAKEAISVRERMARLKVPVAHTS